MPPQVAAAGHVDHRPESRLHCRGHLGEGGGGGGGGRIGRHIVGVGLGIIVGLEILRLRFEVPENKEAGKSR